MNFLKKISHGKYLRWTLLLVILMGFVVSFVLFLYPVPQNDTDVLVLAQQEPVNSTGRQSGQTGTNIGQVYSVSLFRLSIPVIGVDASVVSVGITPDGEMDIPKDPAHVAWFKFGPRPGESGSAVIAGHYGLWENGGKSVFDNLHTLHKGDTLYVVNDKGVTVSFVVREIKTYDPAADASDVFTSHDGKSHLNLITCAGVWDKISKSYSQRLVVFTDRK